jgi:radical SAM superfamily enzyme YgiQ (UPF0313 family)
MSDFIDSFHIGEGDSSILEILDTYTKIKELKKDKGTTRKKALEAIGELSYMYNPGDYTFEYDETGLIKEIKGDKKATRNIYYDFESEPTKYSYLIPNITPLQDKGTLQVARGCTQGCRFCHAGIIDRPVREKKATLLIEQAKDLIDKTGNRELSFNSLSISDYSEFNELFNGVMGLQNRGINIGLPSLRVEAYNLNVAKSLNSLRKSGLTFAVEAGSCDGRSIINKPIEKEKLLNSINSAIAAGWKSVKLYFMIGLPFIEDEANAIFELAEELAELGRKNKLRKFANISINAFVPKPFTPFQWQGMVSLDILKDTLKDLKSKVNRKYVNLKWNDLNLSFVEGSLSRGDRRIGKVILDAYQNGALFDGWDEEFRNDIWRNAFSNNNLDLEWYSTRVLDINAKLPWDMVDVHVSKTFLQKEFEAAKSRSLTESCRDGKCTACGKFPQKCPVLTKEEKSPTEINPPAKSTLLDDDEMKFKVNIIYKRKGLKRFISHLDVLRLWEKVLRMAEVPMCYSKGYNPHPKITYSSPNPLGVESFAEWLRLEIKKPTQPEKLIELLSKYLPEDIEIVSANMGQAPQKNYNYVEYSISNLPLETKLDPKHEGIKFEIELKEIEPGNITLFIPYPEPMGIYKILEKMTGKPREELLNLKIVKSKLY